MPLAKIYKVDEAMGSKPAWNAIPKVTLVIVGEIHATSVGPGYCIEIETDEGTELHTYDGN